MKPTIFTVKELLINKLNNPDYRYTFDKDSGTLQVKNDRVKNAVTIQLAELVKLIERDGESALYKQVYYITSSFAAAQNTKRVEDHMDDLYPVIRSSSFPLETKEGEPFIVTDHTAETRIYYVLDLGNTYRLLTQKDTSVLAVEKIKSQALINLNTKKIPLKEDNVAGNRFYFVRTNDGYDASRLLNEKFMEKMEKNAKGQIVVAVPHQDVLLLVDVVNEAGYDVIGHLTLDFYASGPVPITTLAFEYSKGHLTPVFILAKNKQKGL